MLVQYLKEIYKNCIIPPEIKDNPKVFTSTLANDGGLPAALALASS